MSASLLPVRGSPGSPYTRKMLAVLRFRRIPYRYIQGGLEGDENLPEPKVKLIPVFYFANESDEPSLMVGFFAGAKDVAATGIEYGDAVTADDLATPRGEPNGGILINLDDVQPENMDQGDGWLITDFRLPISARNGCSSTLFRARFLPGAVHKKHRHDNCDEIYYIISGHGLAGAGSDRVEVRGGHFHFIPKGVEHWLHNLSETEPIEVVGLYCGAGSVAATGYVYMGDVTSEDLAARTG